MWGSVPVATRLRIQYLIAFLILMLWEIKKIQHSTKKPFEYLSSSYIETEKLTHSPSSRYTWSLPFFYTLWKPRTVYHNLYPSNMQTCCFSRRDGRVIHAKMRANKIMWGEGVKKAPLFVLMSFYYMCGRILWYKEDDKQSILVLCVIFSRPFVKKPNCSLGVKYK